MRSDASAALRPNDLLHWEIMRWAKAHGFAFYDFGGFDERLYALTDLRYSVMAVANTSGTIVERFRYEAHGRSTALNADFKAKEAIEPNLGRLVGSMAAFKPRGQGG